MEKAKCIQEGCKKQACHNLPGATGAVYCVIHKLEKMVNVQNACIHEGCQKRPNFNVDGETKAIYCVTHRLEGMSNVNDKRCIHAACKKQPSFIEAVLFSPSYYY